MSLISYYFLVSREVGTPACVGRQNSAGVASVFGL